MDEYSKAKLRFHNAQHHFEALEKKYRKRLGQIDSLRIELAQLESGLPVLSEKLEQAKSDLKTAKAIYRPLRQVRKKYVIPSTERFFGKNSSDSQTR
jgi:multidrug resistance efflux pump